MITLLDRGRFFWPMWVWIGVLLLGSGSMVANAQVQATCLTGFSYYFNKEGQSPCQVFSLLMSACLSASAPFPVPSLSSNFYEIPSSGANACSCNTVTYSMMSACSICQNQGQDTLSFTSWSQSCNAGEVAVDKYPLNIPNGTSIPSWAFNDLDANDRFVFALAQTNTAPDSVPATTSTASVTPLNNVLPSTLPVTSIAFLGPSKTPTPSDIPAPSTSSTPSSVSSNTTSQTSILSSSTTTTTSNSSEQMSTPTETPQSPVKPSNASNSTSVHSTDSPTATAAAAALGKSREPLGIVLGVVGALFFLVLAFIGYMVLRRRARRRAASAEMVEVPRDDNPFNRSIESFTSMSPLRNNFVGNDGDDTRTISTGASGAPLLRRIQAVSTRWSSLLNRQTRAMSRAASLSIAGASRGSLVKTRPTPPEPLPEPDEVYIRRVHEKIDALHAQHAEIRAAIRPPSGEMRLAAQSHLLGPDFISPIRTSSVVANASATERHRESTHSDGGSSGWETTSVGSATWPSHAFVR